MKIEEESLLDKIQETKIREMLGYGMGYIMKLNIL